MSKIKKIIAREILDSHAYPAIEAIIQLQDGSVGVYSPPTGVSKSKYEAVELRDGDPKRYYGLGVLQALRKIATVIAPQILGYDAAEQVKIDQIMIGLDGTNNKSNLGANTILAISGAVVKAQAASSHIPLYQYIASLTGKKTSEFSIPTPMFNILNGGKHGSHNLDFQEFLIVPIQSNSLSKDLNIGVNCYFNLKETLKSHNFTTLVGEEGGFAPTLYSNMDAFKILEEAIYKAGYRIGLDLFFSLDVAAASIIQGSAYRIKDKPVPMTAADFVEFYLTLNEQYHLLSLEDPLNDEFDMWRTLTEKLGNETLIVGDDIISTNPQRLQKAISEKACNAVIIKPNQIGTISETLEIINAAKTAKSKIIVSHRSGETNEDFIADFAVGVGADYGKFGAPARGERVAKYNRLLEIEHELS